MRLGLVWSVVATTALAALKEEDVIAAMFGTDGEADLRCEFATQLFYLQDVSYSYSDDLPFIRGSLPNFLNALTTSRPGSKMALGSFTDYPFVDVGFMGYEPRDYCFRMEQDFTDDVNVFTNALDNLRIVSGRDFPEASLVTLHHAVLGGYFSEKTQTPEGVPLVKVAVVSTDGPAHMAGDLEKMLLKQPQYWDNPSTKYLFGDTDEMPKFTVVPNDGDGVLSCGVDPNETEFEDYVTLEQLGRALKANDVYTIFMVTAEVYDSWQAVSDTLRTQFGVYTDVKLLAEDSRDLTVVFASGVRSIISEICSTRPTFTPGAHGTIDLGVCDGSPVLDLFVVTDTSASYSNDVENLRNLLPSVADDIAEVFLLPRYGVAWFSDKPVAPFGSKKSQDACYRLGHGITDYETARDTINGFTIHSGLDWKECQLEAIISAALQEGSGWRDDSDFQLKVVYRVLAIITDSGYHQQGDGAAGGLTAVNPGDGYADELIHDYPSVEQAVAAVKKANLMPLFIVTDDVYHHYTELAKKFSDAGVFTAVQRLRDDSADIANAILSGIADLCDQK